MENNKLKGLIKSLSEWVAPKKETSLTATTATQESLSASKQLQPGFIVSSNDTLSSGDYTFYTPPTSGVYQVTNVPNGYKIDSDYYSNIIKEREKREKEYEEKVKEIVSKFEPLTQEILAVVPKNTEYFIPYGGYSLHSIEADRKITMGRTIDNIVKKHLFKNKLEDIINE